MKNKLLLGIVGTFCLLGIFFLGLLVHEGIHILQSKAPESICYSFGEKNTMYVVHNTEKYTQEEYNNFKTYTEKWGNLGMLFVLMLGTIFLSYTTIWYGNKRKIEHLEDIIKGLRKKYE